jgi:hypothetical protein
MFCMWLGFHAGALRVHGVTNGSANFPEHAKNSGRRPAVKFGQESYVR